MERETQNANGVTLVLTGLSGSGKTSIIDAALRLGKYYGISINAIPKYTTRPPRQTGTAMYHHIVPDVFDEMWSQKEFAFVHSHADHMYGVRRSDLKVSNGIVTIPPHCLREALSVEEFCSASVIGIAVDLPIINRRLKSRVWNSTDDLQKRIEHLSLDKKCFDDLSGSFRYILQNPDPVLEEEHIAGYPAWFKCHVQGRVRDVADRVLAIAAWENVRYASNNRFKDYTSWLAGAIVKRNTDTNPDTSIPKSVRYLRINEERLLRHVRGDPLEAALLQSFFPINVRQIIRNKGRTEIELSCSPAPQDNALEKLLLADLLVTAYRPHFHFLRDNECKPRLFAKVDDKSCSPEIVIRW